MVVVCVCAYVWCVLHRETMRENYTFTHSRAHISLCIQTSTAWRRKSMNISAILSIYLK